MIKKPLYADKSAPFAWALAYQRIKLDISKLSELFPVQISRYRLWVDNEDSSKDGFPQNEIVSHKLYDPICLVACALWYFCFDKTSF